MNRKDVCVYLAGPISNCNFEQKTEWRKRIKAILSTKGYKVLDPTASDARPGSLAVNADIQDADIVIANLWRESIGTTVGIVLARQSLTPVILIDQNYNYLNIPILNELVGDYVCHQEKDVLGMTEEIFAQLSRQFSVTKSDRERVRFDRKKLREALKHAFSKAAMDDAILLPLLMRRVFKRLQDVSRETQEVSTAQIKLAIFEQLDDVIITTGNPELRAVRQVFRTQWEEFERKKDHNKALDELAVETERINDEVEKLKAENQRLRDENFKLTQRLQLGGRVDSLSANSETLGAMLKRKFNGKKSICLSAKHHSGFKSILVERGLDESVFDDLFEEATLGLSGSSKRELNSYVDRYAFVLHAGLNTCHPVEKAAHATNYLSAPVAREVIDLFLSRIRSTDPSH